MTGRTPQEVIRDQVRTQVQELLSSAGVDQGRVALEVLYWMPVEFLEDYRDLFMRALHLGDGDDRDKAGADEGRLVKKVKPEIRGKKGGMHATGGGKRYKTEWVVKDEKAMDVKRRVDNKLKNLVRQLQGMDGMDGMDAGRGRQSRGSRGGHGSSPGEYPREAEGGISEVPITGGKVLRKCKGCGRIMKGDWVRCPFQHS